MVWSTLPTAAMISPPRKRRKSYDVCRQAHALTFSTYRRQPFFSDQELADLYCRTLFDAADNIDFEVWAFVVMPDHCHILLFPRGEGSRMADILKAIKAPLAKEALRIRPEIREMCRVARGDGTTVCQFWQPGGGYDFNIYSEDKIANFIAYCHNNPVRRGLCQTAEEWRWSSFDAYNGGACPWPVVCWSP